MGLQPLGLVGLVDGKEVMPYRLSWMLVRQNGSWQIAPHHGAPWRSD